jgi:hypothetical protein
LRAGAGVGDERPGNMRLGNMRLGNMRFDRV